MHHFLTYPHLDSAHLRSPIEPAHTRRAQRLVEAADASVWCGPYGAVHDRLHPALTILAYHRVIHSGIGLCTTPPYFRTRMSVPFRVQ